MTVKYFNVKNGLTAGPITLDATSGNATATNLSVTGISDLGAIANVNITGGVSGQAIITDGSGNLTFGNVTATTDPAPMPYYVGTGTTITIPEDYQGIFGYPITIDGTIVVDGIMIDVNDSTVPAGYASYVQYNNGNVMGGVSSFTFVASTGILSVPNITTTGVVKTTATTYSALPLAAVAGAGARAFITNANTTTFLATVGGGGSNSVPVVSNGTVWVVG